MLTDAHAFYQHDRREELMPHDGEGAGEGMAGEGMAGEGEAESSGDTSAGQPQREAGGPAPAAVAFG